MIKLYVLGHAEQFVPTHWGRLRLYTKVEVRSIITIDNDLEGPDAEPVGLFADFNPRRCFVLPRVGWQEPACIAQVLRIVYHDKCYVAGTPYFQFDRLALAQSDYPLVIANTNKRTDLWLNRHFGSAYAITKP